MASNQNAHKPGPLKQQNKAHKHGRHRTKGQLENTHKGKVDIKSISKKNKTIDKNQRRHQAKQVRKNKREEVLEKKRKLGTEHSPPHLIAIFPLSSLCNGSEALQYLIESDDTIVSFKKNNITTIISPRHRQRFQVIEPERNLYSVINAAKVADSFLFLIPAKGDLDEIGQRCLTCILAQGLPTNIQAVQGLRYVKKQGDAKKNIQRILEKWIPDVKLHSLDSKQDGELVLRLLGNQKQRRIFYRENRPYLLADKLEFEEGNSDKGVLKISGYVRGKTLSVNKLVHLPQLGEFQIKQIDLPKDPYTMKRKDTNSNEMDKDDDTSMEEDIKTIAVADPSKQESLITEAEVDPMDAEQTWPTEEEIIQAQEEVKKQMIAQKIMKKVPKGTSEYQAAWIADEDDDENDESEYEDEESDEEYAMMEQSDDDGGEEQNEEKEEYDTISIAATTVINDEKYDEQFDMDEEQKQLEKYRLEHENEMFPDEVDTPQDIAARDRFQRYRGLKSFRTSPWDPKENLPLDYARIFQFQNFNRTKKRVLKLNAEEDDTDEGAMVGWYVTIHVANVPRVYFENVDPLEPLVVFGLLPYEQKMTVMNFVIKRHPSSTVPVKSKERLIFHVGYRTFSACPIFSQHTNGDKFKGERFLPHDAVTMATVYAPIFFPPSPVLVFTENSELLATGTVAGSDPDRVVVKKIVLSGHPFKINKKSSVVRYMFFNRDDILWFKPVELYTKYGRRGNIKEPLGTHGHMKCVFDGQLKAQDTVCMNLFKRLFPKWTYDPNVDIRSLKMTLSLSSDTFSKIEEEGDVEM